MPARSPIQPFRFDIDSVLSVAQLIDSGTSSLDSLAQALATGQRKVRSIREWGCMSGILADSSTVTGLYHRVRDLVSAGRRVEPCELAYYLLCQNNAIIQNIANDSARLGRFNADSVVRSVVDSGVLGTNSERNILHGVRVSLDSLAGGTGVDSSSGLGLLDILHDIENAPGWYTVHPHAPHVLVAGYILYSAWPPDTAKVAISEVAAGRNSLGRVFFLEEAQVIGLLRALEARGLVKVEMAAGINQIGINPKVTANDILDMLIQEAAT